MAAVTSEQEKTLFSKILKVSLLKYQQTAFIIITAIENSEIQDNLLILG